MAQVVECLPASVRPRPQTPVLRRGEERGEGTGGEGRGGEG
jgi:hypothetical protein